MTTTITPHDTSSVFNLIVNSLLLTSAIVSLITPFVIFLLLRIIREEFASHRRELDKLARKDDSSARVKPKVISQPDVNIPLHEATPAEKASTTKAALAKTVLITKPVQQAPENGTPQPQIAEQNVTIRRPNEVTRVNRAGTAKAVNARTVLIAKQLRQPKAVAKLYVAKDGENLGEIDVATIRAMLKAGKLSARDHFFEMNKQIWASFECMPGFCA